MKKLLQKYTGFLRTLKAVYVANNLLHLSQLQHNKPLYRKFGVKKPVFAPISSTDFASLPPQPSPWLDQPNALQKLQSTPELSAFPDQVREQIQEWPNNGYLMLDKFFSEETVDGINQEIDDMLQSRLVDFNYTNRKIMFAFRQSEKIKEVVFNSDLVKVLEFILGKKVIPFQTINFLKGSEQKAHSDTIHMTTYPLGNLIAVWIALEDITSDNGPLFYYPGSHKLPYVLNPQFDNGGSFFRIGDDAYPSYEKKIGQVIEENQLEQKIFYAKKGDAFVWHANLLHGGCPILDPEATRKSMVIHYYAQDAICYHEITQRPALFPKDLQHQFSLRDDD
ncbi:phytanoyl-CoA dioxygenase family protein [Rufibacter roseus]|uniref:Phytanoyl-CoA dioxygenase family protein n=1 Tax=Rufibacter roseus TaxID=1567108 RepID=A0ABW2DLE4_9BACT|nr:phytanoyl-CoA dioxygenase family protein [Rufibacter roseus]